MSFKFRKPHKDLDVQDIQRQLEDFGIYKDKNGDIRLDGDIYCKDLHADEESIFLGDFKISAPKGTEDQFYMKAERNDVLNKAAWSPDLISIEESIQWAYFTAGF